ncbi:MAG: hypothetical protein M3377_05520 [Actinomycetota bacterium]|nr:hypothetical protein [Actinomycetota bacterium]
MTASVKLVRYAQLLAWSSLLWITAEGAIAIFAGITAEKHCADRLRNRQRD